MEKYKYRKECVSYKTNEELNEKLSEFGLDGWNIINFSEDKKINNRVREYTVMMKKRISNATEKKLLNG